MAQLCSANVHTSVCSSSCTVACALGLSAIVLKRLPAQQLPTLVHAPTQKCASVGCVQRCSCCVIPGSSLRCRLGETRWVALPLVKSTADCDSAKVAWPATLTQPPLLLLLRSPVPAAR
eukprot:364927-Chlamydomonas_euryale.AAC.18